MVVKLYIIFQLIYGVPGLNYRIITVTYYEGAMQSVCTLMHSLLATWRYLCYHGKLDRVQEGMLAFGSPRSTQFYKLST